jgi:hypothetical protein
MPSHQTLPGPDEPRASPAAGRRPALLIALGLWVFITLGYVSVLPVLVPSFVGVRGVFIGVWMLAVGGWCGYRTYGYFRAVAPLSRSELATTVLLPLLAVALLQLLFRLR